jgi:hypothetical protein
MGVFGISFLYSHFGRTTMRVITDYRFPAIQWKWGPHMHQFTMAIHLMLAASFKALYSKLVIVFFLWFTCCKPYVPYVILRSWSFSFFYIFSFLNESHFKPSSVQSSYEWLLCQPVSIRAFISRAWWELKTKQSYSKTLKSSLRLWKLHLKP